MTFLLLAKPRRSARTSSRSTCSTACSPVYAELLARPARPRAPTGCSSTSPPWSPTARPPSWPPSTAAYARLRTRCERRPSCWSPPTSASSASTADCAVALPVTGSHVDLVRAPDNSPRPAQPCGRPGRQDVCRRRGRRPQRLAHRPGRARWPTLRAAARALAGTGSTWHRPARCCTCRSTPTAETGLDPAAARAGWRSPSRRSPRWSPSAAALTERPPHASPPRWPPTRPSRLPRDPPSATRPSAARRRAVRPPTPAAPSLRRTGAAAQQAAHLQLPLLPDHHDRLLPADRASCAPARAACAAGRDRRGRRTTSAIARRDRAGHRAAGGARARRARARRARAQRHGAVLRRAARRLRRHPARLGAVLRLALRHARRSCTATSRRPAADDRRAGPRTPSRSPSKPVKGMLTGPVTMLAWSFVRDDQPLRDDRAARSPLAVRDEVRDLEAAGIRVIQVDEPALRERLPLRARDRPPTWTGPCEAFRLATSGVRRRDADPHAHVLRRVRRRSSPRSTPSTPTSSSIEAARSGMELLERARPCATRSEIGPGVYDIHSPRVPGADEIGAPARGRRCGRCPPSGCGSTPTAA